jgi:zinc D-Ala-D-Ala dipeptidase
VTPKPTAKWDRTKGRPEPVRLLNRIQEAENGEPLVNLAEVCPQVIIEKPQVIPYLRATVAEMLRQAAESLPDGIRLAVIDAWRPLERQQRIYDFVWKCAVETFPGRPVASLRRTVCRWVAPTDQVAPPGHCTGAAVDVWLVDANGDLIDVCAPYDRFGAAPTYSYGLTESAQRHRDLLIGAMLEVGFSNCRDEWWHYSFGDAGWAVRTGVAECPYGLISLDHHLYTEQERLSEEAFKTRPNPFTEEV